MEPEGFFPWFRNLSFGVSFPFRYSYKDFVRIYNFTTHYLIILSHRNLLNSPSYNFLRLFVFSRVLGSQDLSIFTVIHQASHLYKIKSGQTTAPVELYCVLSPRKIRHGCEKTIWVRIKMVTKEYVTDVNSGISYFMKIGLKKKTSDMHSANSNIIPIFPKGIDC